jgi:hypothetical protein
MGIDLGLNNLVITSDGLIVKGELLRALINGITNN